MLSIHALKLVPFVDVTPLFSLRENAIAKEPGLSYPECWRASRHDAVDPRDTREGSSAGGCRTHLDGKPEGENSMSEKA